MLSESGGAEEEVTDFNFDPPTGVVPLTVHFHDISTARNEIVKRLWNFGDGGTSTEQNPTYVYNRGEWGGWEDVTLSASSDYFPVYFSAEPTEGEVPLTVKFKVVSIDAEPQEYEWDFGDGGTSTEESPTHIYNFPGLYTVGLGLEYSVVDYPDDNWKYLYERNYINVSGRWYYDLPSTSYGGSAVGDIDNDGKLEVVFGTYLNDGHVYALDAEDHSLLWKFPSPGGRVDTPVAIADVNKDDNLEVLFADSEYGTVFCLNAGDGSKIWSYDLSSGTESAPAVGELDNNDDGMPEVVVGDFEGNVYVLNGEDGTLVWENDQNIEGWVNDPTLVDVDGDGNLDVVVATWEGDNSVHALKGSDGTEIWSFQTGGSIYHGPSYADIDGNDNLRPELVFTSQDGYLYVLNCEDGSEVWKEYLPDEDLFAPTSIGDINNDGDVEIIVAGYNLYAYSRQGEQLWKYDHPDVSIPQGVAIADIDGDGVMDLAFGDREGIFSIVKGMNGSLTWSFDARSDYGDDEFEIDHAPIIADFDGDGQLDVFFVGGRGSESDPDNNYGRAYMIRKEEGGTGEGWHMFKYDLAHSGGVYYTITLTVLGAEGSPGQKDVPVTILVNEIGNRELFGEIYGAELTLDYDSSLLKPVRAKIGAFIPGGEYTRIGWSAYIDKNFVDKVEITVAGIFLSPRGIVVIPLPSGGGELVKIYFDVKEDASGESPLTLSKAKFISGGHSFRLIPADRVENNIFTIGSTSSILGDVSGNGVVRIHDAYLTAKYAVGLIDFTPEQIRVAEVDGKGRVTMNDAWLIAEYAIGLRTKFPVEE